MLHETELNIISKVANKLTESVIGNIDIKSPVEHQVQKQELKDSGWGIHVDKINPMKINFHKNY